MANKIIDLNDDNFQKEVVQCKTPVIVDCYADWCGPCKMFAPTFDKVAEAYAGKVKFCKLNIDNAEGTVQELGVMSVPTTLYYKDGNLVSSVAGAMDEHKFLHRVEDLLKS
jgi:thioredoxin 1